MVPLVVTVEVLVLVDVDVELLVVLTVEVLVELLLVSTSVDESYTVCAATLVTRNPRHTASRGSLDWRISSFSFLFLLYSRKIATGAFSVFKGKQKKLC